MQKGELTVMNIENLIKERTEHKIAVLPISDKELCDRYEKVTTAMVNDVLREDGILYNTLPNNILPLKDDMKVCGIAFTIKGSKNLNLEDEMQERAKMLEAIPEDSICVWDTSNDDESAQWGEIMTLAKNINKAIGVYYENLETVAENYIIPWLNLGYEKETLEEIAKVCFKTSVRTLEGMNGYVQKLFKLGIITSESLAKYINGVIESDKEIKNVLEKLGLSRNVNYFDRENFKTWKNNWKISDELIEYGSSLARDKSQPMQYLNRVLSSWHDNNVKSLEDAKKFATPTNSTTQKTEPLKGRSYTREELNALIQSVDEVEI